jgi:hypothetical protein
MSDITFAAPMKFSVSFATASGPERARMIHELGLSPLVMDGMGQLPFDVAPEILTLPLDQFRTHLLIGMTNSGMTNSLERVDPRTPRWQELNSRKPRRKGKR